MSEKKCGSGSNPYLPYISTVLEVIEESPTIQSVRVKFNDKESWDNFDYEPGQVGQLSVFGSGESTFVINSPPSKKKDYLQFSVMRTGEVTASIHALKVGDQVGVRAPLGNFWPWEDWKGKNVFFVGGGIGMAPIRTVMEHLMERHKDYGKLSLLYGARSYADMAFKTEVESWLKDPVLDCTLTVDVPTEDWKHKAGLIPNILKEINPAPANTVVAICGPPIMIKFTIMACKELGFADEQIYTTLERRMKCGIGICGRCNLGEKYICLDGPVFTQAELNNLPPEL